MARRQAFHLGRRAIHLHGDPQEVSLARHRYLRASRSPSTRRTICTAVFHLDAPSPYMMRALAAAESPILPKHIYDGHRSAAQSGQRQKPIGTGPFKFKEWQRGSYIMLERNPDYWDQPRPYLDTLIFRFIPDGAARAVALESGDVQYGTQYIVSDERRGAPAGAAQSHRHDRRLRIQHVGELFRIQSAKAISAGRARAPRHRPCDRQGFSGQERLVRLRQGGHLADHGQAGGVPHRRCAGSIPTIQRRPKRCSTRPASSAAPTACGCA